jgi:flagellar basal-body rod protein FlgB
MFLGNDFGKTLDVLHRSMDAGLLRHNVIANNIANSDTPNFKRSMVNFESQLKRALDSENVRKLPAKLTHPRHIPFNRPMDYRNVRPRRVLDYQTTAKNNGNNVDIEEESMNLLNNQLMYSMMSQSLNTQFRQLNLVLS